MTRLPRALLLISALALTLISPAHLQIYSWQEDELIRTPFGRTLISSEPTALVDLNADDIQEKVILEQGTVRVLQEGFLLWSSPPDWEVTQARIADLNRDDQLEIALLLWREFAPWPIDAWLVYPGRIKEFHDQVDRSCHVILIGWRAQNFVELWAGSALSEPLLAFEAVDLNDDGNQELIALEARYNGPSNKAQAVSVWEWNGFGFTLLSRGPEGVFRAIHTVRSVDGTPLFLIEGNLRR